jgi:hypothetical protein
VYVTVLLDVFPAASVAFTTNVFEFTCDVVSLEPFATDPVHALMPEPASVQAYEAVRDALMI